MVLLANPLRIVADPRRCSGRLGSVDAAHFFGKGRVRKPGGRIARGDFFHHFVDLLERQALHLGDQEVGEEEGQDAEGAPDEEDLGS